MNFLSLLPLFDFVANMNRNDVDRYLWPISDKMDETIIHYNSHDAIETKNICGENNCNYKHKIYLNYFKFA